MNNAHQIIVVVGPTAIGKTKLAIELSRYWDCNIISADSRQYYKEMYLGTAVPSDTELKSAPHFLIQHKSIQDSYTVGDFEREALALIADFSKTKQKTIVVGGSGLYINALLYGLNDFPEVPKTLRAELNQKFKDLGLNWLQQELKRLDPDYYNQVDLMNPQRIIRALEVCISSGVPFSSWQTTSIKQRPFKFVIIGITAPRSEVYQRINLRVDQMIENGLIEEARQLWPYRELNALNTVGYKELFEYFDKKIELDQAIDLIKQNTRRFAKRQMTWFKKNQDIQWFESESELEKINEYIDSYHWP